MTEMKGIPIEFTRSKNHQILAATGAFGGISPNGEFLANFYVEHAKLPDNLSAIIDPKTGIGKEQKLGDETRKFIREIQVTLVIRPDIAKSIGEWLVRESEKALKSGE